MSSHHARNYKVQVPVEQARGIRLGLQGFEHALPQPSLTLGRVGIHRDAMTAAARWIMAAKLWSVLSLRMAIRLNSFSLQKKFSIK